MVIAGIIFVWFPSVILWSIAGQLFWREVEAIDFIIDSGVVDNIQSANLTAKRFSSTDYVDLTCKVDYSILDGPGAHLTNGIFLGDTVARETFVTQFVQDVSLAANVSTSRVFVLEIAPGRVHHDWEANNVIILFRLVDNVIAGTSAEDGMVAAITSLTSQAQESGSALFGGLVTDRLDPSWGIVAVNLDVSLRLTTAIEIIGGNNVLEGYYLNQGAQKWCDNGRSSGDTEVTESVYCRWESWFIADISGALAPLDPERVGVLSVKRAAVDAVLVQFRLGEPSDYAMEMTVDEAVVELLDQVRNASSVLFTGNVTVSVDPTWGLSGDGGVAREYSPHLPHDVYDDHLNDSYERCKDVHRCSRTWAHYNSTSRTVHYTTQAFRDGFHVAAALFADFENWRMGTFGWSMPDARNQIEADEGKGLHGVRKTAPKGAHFDPRNFSSLGPRTSAEARGFRDFSGLVLDAQQKDRELARLDMQAAQLRDKVSYSNPNHHIVDVLFSFDNACWPHTTHVKNIEKFQRTHGRTDAWHEKLAWIEETRETALLDATRRSRYDAALAADGITSRVRSELDVVLGTREALNSTQCLVFKSCPDQNGTASATEGYGNYGYEWWADENGSIAESLRGHNASCPCTLVFNTSNLLLEGPISAVGEVALTEAGTEVAVWSFDQVYLGPEIPIEVTGQRAMALLSRGSLVLNTTIAAEPSTLGGFPGGGGIARDPGGGERLLFPPSVPPAFPLGSLTNGSLHDSGVPSYNVNGPGSANYRYYLFTITTSADDIGEVQQICTSATKGQTLDGCFHLSYGNLSTECVPHDASPSSLQDIIEGGLNAEPLNRPGILPSARPRGSAVDSEGREQSEISWTAGVGRVNVTTDGLVDDEGGRCWSVTFSSAVGAVGPLTLSAASASTTAARQRHEGNKLSGLGAAAIVKTLRAGNDISGNFSLRFAGGETTALFPSASAEAISEALMELPEVEFAWATRVLPIACHGNVRCYSGQTPGGGLEWIVEVGTLLGNAEPTSPTVAVGKWDEGIWDVKEGEFDWPEAVSYLGGSGAGVGIKKGWARSLDRTFVGFNASQPFSIALGGTGASHGGIGGFGPEKSFSNSASGTPRDPYSSPSIPDLIGGSGGARSGPSPAAMNALGTTGTTATQTFDDGGEGLGGGGGGGIELVALNDVTIGIMGSISVDGGDGAEEWNSGGGGGSGGSLIVAAGGVIRHAGSISARGGDGGRPRRPLSLEGGGGGAGGRVALYGQSVELAGAEGDRSGRSGAVVNVNGGRCFVTTASGDLRDDACGEGREGGQGSFHLDAAFGYTLVVDDGYGLGGAGAEGTNSSLHLSRKNGAGSTSSGQPFQAFRSFDGPEYAVRSNGVTHSPGRATFYLKVAAAAPLDSKTSSEKEHASERISHSNHASNTEWGAVFVLLGPGLNDSSRQQSYWEGEEAFLRNSSASSEWTPPTRRNSSHEMAFPVPNSTLIGVAVVGGVMVHGSGFSFPPGDQGENESPTADTDGVLDGRVEGERWYKVDIMMRWDDDNGTAGEYDVLVDDVARTENHRFGWTGGSGNAGGVERVGLYILGEGRAWFDEIYLGPDFTMGFRCPRSSRRGVELRNTGRLKRWEGLVDPGQNRNKIMQRHTNFLSSREKYTTSNGVLVTFDGDGMREYLVDEYVRDYSDPPYVEGLKAGSLLEVPRGEDFVTNRALRARSARSLDGNGLWSSDASGNSHAGNRRFWYGEHEVTDGVQYWGRGLATDGDWTGGIGACSTDDMVDWKFEGIMLHYSNVSDMVLGREPEGGMVLQQPKTLRLETAIPRSNASFPNETISFSTLTDTLGSSQNDNPSVEYETYVMWMGAGESNGTFGMAAVATSHHPDGPFNLRRTLYPDGNETRDQSVFIGADGRGYLARTYYAEVEYVLPEAVMQPVWDSVQKEDGTVDFGLSYHRAFYSKYYDDYHDIYLQRWRMEDQPWHVTCVNRITGESRDVPYGEFNKDRGYCDQPKEYKVVLGQGYPVVSSRFKDPENTNNSFWSPESVPSVKAQSWGANYRDGLCGIREMDEGFDLNNADLDTISAVNRSTCSNIADNPVHDTLPDKLMGTQTVVETRLAKYVAVSRLTRDLLDTSAVTMSFEGELEGQDDLMTLIEGKGYDRFDWSAGNEIRSTYHPQVFSDDFKTTANGQSLFHQYEASENDRAKYSLACQLDGKCPVNFRDESAVDNESR